MEENRREQVDDEAEKESIQQMFGQNVRKYRKSRNLTQEQLSEKLGISQKHLSIIETGTQFASASLIARISSVLEVSPGDLFGGTNDGVQEMKKMCTVLLSTIMNEMNHKFAGVNLELDNIKQLIQRNGGVDSDMF
ncbi:MAG: helix-turn-helix domain-containing protein [Treponema sp.]|nr:helix-turn-helix domain-containing protein [Treponema sp.]